MQEYLCCAFGCVMPPTSLRCVASMDDGRASLGLFNHQLSRYLICDPFFLIVSRETDPDRLNQDMVDSVLDRHLSGRYLEAFYAKP